MRVWGERLKENDELSLIVAQTVGSLRIKKLSPNRPR
jgi:hypothetical protein